MGAGIKMIYNLTTHICQNDRVETEPRLNIIRNVRDSGEIVGHIKAGIANIPRDSDILIGGHANYILILQQLSKTLGYRIWLWDMRTQSPYRASFLNRIDNIISFNNLDKDNIKTIIGIELESFVGKLTENGIGIELDDTTKEFLFEKGWDEDMGARPLKRAIQKYIEDEISVMLITKEIKNGDVIKIIKSLVEDKLEFIKKNELLSLGTDEVKGEISNNN